MPVTGSISTNEAAILLKAVKMGGGVAVLPLFAVQEEIAAGRLLRLLPEYEPDRLTVSAVYLTQKKMPQAQRVLIDYLVKHLRLP